MPADASTLRALAAQQATVAANTTRMAGLAVRKSGMDAVAIAQTNAPVDTGFHRGGIGMDNLGPTTVQFGASSSYGPYLENGTYKMPPRPHIVPAGEQVEPLLAQALESIGVELVQ